MRDEPSGSIRPGLRPGSPGHRPPLPHPSDPMTASSSSPPSPPFLPPRPSAFLCRRFTPAVEAVWSKRRIVEVYLNVAEMGEGVFGVEAAARNSFGVGPENLSPRQAALLAAVLPAPKQRSAARPSSGMSKRANAIMDGAATIRADGRSACFED